MFPHPTTLMTKGIISMIYLYIKQHTVTGLKYFGKTIKNDPEKYKGSGTDWLKHIEEYGNNVDTLGLWEFNDLKECSEFALQFSKDNNIVESKDWANLVYENVISGTYGLKHSENTKAKMSRASKGKPKSEAHKKKMREIIRSKEHRSNLSKSLKGRILSEEHKTKISLNHSRHSNKSRLNQPHSEDTKRKISESNIGQLRNNETKRKISESKQNRMWITNDIISKMIKISEFCNYDSSWRQGKIHYPKKQLINM